MKAVISLIFLQFLTAVPVVTAFAFTCSHSGQPFSPSLRRCSNNDDDAKDLKLKLLQNIATLNKLQVEDGKISVDFGVKGGEIDKKSLAPKKLDFYTVSKRVGEAADEIFYIVDDLSKVNPTKEATEGFEGATSSSGEEVMQSKSTSPPLDGTWQLLFSTAADANFSRDSKRGDAMAMNIVDAKKGKITNVIRFAPKDDGTPKAVDELRVKLSAKAEGPNRIDLTFKYVAVKLTKLLFIPIRWTLYIPVPSPMISKFIIFFSNLKNRLLFWRKNNENSKSRSLPKAFFDILYLDKNLRVHKTGEDNIFIQARPEWTEAWEIAGQS